MLEAQTSIAPLQILEEIRFWKMQEKDHTYVIRSLSPNLEADYVTLMEEWEAVLGKMELSTDKLVEAVVRSNGIMSPHLQTQISELLRVSLLQSRQFADQLHQLQSASSALSDNDTAKRVIEPIIRESEHFLTTLQPHLNRLDDNASDGFGSTTNLQETTLTGEGMWSRPPVPDQQPVPVGGHTLPPLPYPYNALEPHIDEKTMHLHHDVHHKKYVDDLNKAELALKQARETGNYNLIKHWERELAFNGAGHYLHTLFWNIMNPAGGGKATAKIAAQIDRDFGSFDTFKKQFSQAAEKVEGSGWAILVWSPRSHRLEILQAEKHQNLSQWDVIPLLALDVWEHAYYLKYNADRAKYVEAWWNIVYWPHVNERFATARMVKWHPY
ncbi:MAG: DUF2935 domain-containing protein [Gorillibacterium sp.]|nr:DUF2935 domain-containing protein [Gorillibacterium sp.]